MRIVEFVIEDEEVNGVHAISFVEQPAIESNFIALSKEKVNFAKDEERRMIVGAALIPDKPIPRNGKEGEYYALFSKKTVSRCAHRYIKNSLQSETTLDHEEKINGVTVVESWIKESDNDKSVHFGLDLPIGSWVVMYKIDNDDIWNDEVKAGKVLGLSIEGFFKDKKEVKQSKEERVLSELAKIISN